MSKTPEESDYTSVKRRLRYRQNGLIPFSTNTSPPVDPVQHNLGQLPISFKDYLELLDWTGRQLSSGKRGAIAASAPTIVHRLGYSEDQWIKTQSPMLSWTQKAMGQAEAIKHYCAAIGQRWIWQHDR